MKPDAVNATCKGAVSAAVGGGEFEGLLKAGNFAALHLAGDRFDEPACLALLADCNQVVTVHGCGKAGEVVLMGGRDAGLREVITSRLRALGLGCEDAHAGLAGLDPRNVCNRGRSSAGVQLELSLELRRSPRRALLIRAVREALLRASNVIDVIDIGDKGD